MNKSIFRIILIALFSISLNNVHSQTIDVADIEKKAEALGHSNWDDALVAHSKHTADVTLTGLAYQTRFFDVMGANPDVALELIRKHVAKQNADGSFPPDINDPLWVLAVEDYIKATNRREVSNEFWPIMKKYLTWYEENKHVVAGSIYKDGGKEIRATCLAFLLYDVANRWSIRARDGSSEYGVKAKSIRNTIETKFWNTSKKTFTDEDGKVTIELIWPMVVGACTIPQVTPTVNYLLNPAFFFTKHPCPETPGAATVSNLYTYWAARGVWNQGRSNGAINIIVPAMNDVAAQYSKTKHLYKLYSAKGGVALQHNKKDAHTADAGNNPLIAIAALYEYMLKNKLE